MKKLCFDAGHYKGYNRSNVYPKYFEGDKMWDLHLMIKSYLENNYEVKIETTRGVLANDLALANRGQKARGCEGFYSFHSNACDKEEIDRVVIIRAINKPQLNSYAKELGDTIKRVMGLKGETQVIEKANSSGGEWYGVLRGAGSVGVDNRFIVEHSFHTNKKSAMWLYDIANLNKLAIAEGEVLAKFHNLPKKNKVNNTDVKMIKIIQDVNYRSKADFSKDEYIKGVAKKGEVFTVVERVKSNCSTDMYKLKSGYYITTSSKYVQKYK